MKKIIAASALTLLLPLTASAEDATFSNEGYCLLKESLGKTSMEVKGYERKLNSLGVDTPSTSVCAHFAKIMKESLASKQGQSWNYAHNRPYPGSAIRLTNKQIELLKAAKKDK